MFRREPHQRVLRILEGLRADALEQASCLFGGGTRIVLDLDEYRQSEDLDFLCSDRAGYSHMRHTATTGGCGSLFTDEARSHVQFPRGVRADQYGIRFPVHCQGHSVKLEIILEARLDLSPGERPAWSPVACLSAVDCFASKLLANSDRWADRQVFSRDLIDLAALRSAHGPVPERAWSKAKAAYGQAVETDLQRALEALRSDQDYCKRCLGALNVDHPDRVLRGLDLLAEDIGVS